MVIANVRFTYDLAHPHDDAGHKARRALTVERGAAQRPR
jgi:hypothetical protein